MDHLWHAQLDPVLARDSRRPEPRFRVALPRAVGELRQSGLPHQALGVSAGSGGQSQRDGPRPEPCPVTPETETSGNTDCGSGRRSFWWRSMISRRKPGASEPLSSRYTSLWASLRQSSRVSGRSARLIRAAPQHAGMKTTGDQSRRHRAGGFPVHRCRTPSWRRHTVRPAGHGVAGRGSRKSSMRLKLCFRMLWSGSKAPENQSWWVLPAKVRMLFWVVWAGRLLAGPTERFPARLPVGWNRPAANRSGTGCNSIVSPTRPASCRHW